MELGVHTIDKLLFLLIQGAPGLISLIVLLIIDIERNLVLLEYIVSLVSLQDQAGDIRFKIANGLLSFLLVEVGLIISLDLLKKPFFRNTL